MKIFGQLEKAQIENLGADPTGANLVEGRVWFRTDLKEYRMYINSAVHRIISDSGDGTITLGQLGSTPSNPAASKLKIYAKTDGRLYTLDENGSEIPVGSGSGSGFKNYVPDDTTDIEATIGSWLTDNGAGSPSGLLSLSTTSVVGEVLTQGNSLKLTKSASAALNHFIKLPSKTIDPIDRGKTFNAKFAWKPISGYVGSDLKVVVWDLTNNAELYSFSVNDVTIPNYQGEVVHVFETKGTTAQIELRLVVNNSNANAFTASLDSFFYGPLSFFEVKAEGPVGEVIAMTTTTAPEGFLICEGQAVSRAAYAELFAVMGTTHGQGDGSTTFNVPDYRGRFLRGRANGNSRDPDRASRTAMATGGATGDAVGSVQADEFGSHNHGGGDHNHTSNYSYWNSGSAIAGGSLNRLGFESPGATAALGPLTGTHTSNNISGTIISPNGGNETRPENAYVQFFVRYRSTKTILNNNELALKTAVAKIRDTSGQNLPGSSTTYPVQFNTVDIEDVPGMADIGNNRILILESGNYRLTYINEITNGALGTRFFGRIRRNGNTLSPAFVGNFDANGTGTCIISDVFPLLAGDIIETDLTITDPAGGDVISVTLSAERTSNFKLYGAAMNAGDAVPAGTIISSMATTVPEGYLYCNGQAVSRSVYARLFAAVGTASGNGDGSTTFNVPDLRGMFLRGQNDGSGQDPDAGSRTADNAGGNTGDNVGSQQSHVFASHNHGGGNHNHRLLGTSGSPTPLNLNAGGAIGVCGIGNGGSNLYYSNPAGSGSALIEASGTIIGTEGGSETRPRNIAVRYYIRY